jgi:hypothetical protein
MSTGVKVALFGCLGLILLGIVAAIVIAVIAVAVNKNSNSIAGANTNSSSTANANSKAMNSNAGNSSSSNSSSSGSTSGVHVESIKLARDENGSAGEEVSVFHPKDNPMHAVVRLTEFESGTKVRVVLMAVSVATGEKNTKVAEIEKETGSLQNELDTTFTLPRDWPTGSYRVDVYVNGSLDKSRTYEVES